MKKRVDVQIAAVVLVASLLMGVGCNSGWENPGPVQTFEAFLIDIRRGQSREAFEALTPDDRERLTEPLEEFRGELPPEALPERWEMLITGSADTPLDFKDIEHDADLKTEPEKGAVVELELIYHDGRKGSARMVWGGDRWYVDLPDPSRDDTTTDE